MSESFNWHGRHQLSQKCVFALGVSSVQAFDLANHLQTAPQLLDRVYNRPTLKTLETKSLQGDVNPKSMMVCLCTLYYVMFVPVNVLL